MGTKGYSSVYYLISAGLFLKTCCYFSLDLNMLRTGFHKAEASGNVIFFSHFSWRGLKQINMQGLILLCRRVHVSCLEGQKWKEQVLSLGVYWHLCLAATWAPSRHLIHHRFIC